MIATNARDGGDAMIMLALRTAPPGSAGVRR